MGNISPQNLMFTIHSVPISIQEDTEKLWSVANTQDHDLKLGKRGADHKAVINFNTDDVNFTHKKKYSNYGRETKAFREDSIHAIRKDRNREIHDMQSY